METGNVNIDAEAAFTRERRRRRRERATRWLLRRAPESRRLAYLDLGPRSSALMRRRELGLRAIPLAAIIGTAECAKARAFDHRFRPPASSRHRWQRLWAAGRRGAALPPISVFRLGEKYFVNDGHHRVSVARALGMAAIDAEVIELGARPQRPSTRSV